MSIAVQSDCAEEMRIASIADQIQEKVKEYKTYGIGDSKVKCRNELWSLITSLFYAKMQVDHNATIFYKGTDVGMTFLCQDDMTDLLDEYQIRENGTLFIQNVDQRVTDIQTESEKRIQQFKELDQIDPDSEYWKRIYAALDYFGTEFANHRVSKYTKEIKGEERYIKLRDDANAQMVYSMANSLMMEATYHWKYKGVDGERREMTEGTLFYRGKRGKIPYPESLLAGDFQGRGFNDQVIYDSLWRYMTTEKRYSDFLEENMFNRSADIYRRMKFNKIQTQDDLETKVGEKKAEAQLPKNKGSQLRSAGGEPSDTENHRLIKLAYFAKYLANYQKYAGKQSVRFPVFFVNSCVNGLAELTEQGYDVRYAWNAMGSDMDLILNKPYSEAELFNEFFKPDSKRKSDSKKDSDTSQETLQNDKASKAKNKLNTELVDAILQQRRKENSNAEQVSLQAEMTRNLEKWSKEAKKYKICQAYLYHLKFASIQNEWQAIEHYSEKGEDLMTGDLYENVEMGWLDCNKYKTQNGIAAYFCIEPAGVSDMMEKYLKLMEKFEEKYRNDLGN